MKINKKTLAIFILTALAVSIFAFIPITTAETQTFGYSNAGGSAYNTGTNTLIASGFATTSLENGDWKITTGHIYAYKSTGTPYGKMVIIDGNLNIISVSNEAVAIPTGSTTNYHMLNYTFSPDVYINKLDTDYYFLGFITSSAASWMAGGGDKRISDASNSYASPTDPIDASIVNGGLYSAWIDIVQENEPTPTIPPPNIPDGYLSATFGISPSTAGNILWNIPTDTEGDLESSGETGTYQLMNGTQVNAFASVNAEYVFDHWEATTGEYTFLPEANPIRFTGTNNFNLTAVCVFTNQSNVIRIDMPVSNHGHIDITYTIDGFTNTYGNYRFLYFKPGANITITPDPDAGYIHAQTLITPADTNGPYVTQMFISESLAWSVIFNATIQSTFTIPAGHTAPPETSFEIAILPYLNLLMPVIILGIAALLGYKFAGAWGFFAGVNIGAIITYMTLPDVFPLWGIIALLIIDGLLLFGKVGIRS